MNTLDRDIRALMRRVTETAILPRYRNLSSAQIIEKAQEAAVKRAIQATRDSNPSVVED